MKATYFIQSGGRSGPIKIGSSDDPCKRLAQLQCGNPEPLRLVAVLECDLERLYHDLFREHRIAGEWFSRSIIADLVRLSRHPSMCEVLRLRELFPQMETAGFVRAKGPIVPAFQDILETFSELFSPVAEGEQ